jgi:hypothetical protein
VNSRWLDEGWRCPAVIEVACSPMPALMMYPEVASEVVRSRQSVQMIATAFPDGAVQRWWESGKGLA